MPTISNAHIGVISLLIRQPERRTGTPLRFLARLRRGRCGAFFFALGMKGRPGSKLRRGGGQN